MNFYLHAERLLILAALHAALKTFINDLAHNKTCPIFIACKSELQLPFPYHQFHQGISKIFRFSLELFYEPTL